MVINYFRHTEQNDLIDDFRSKITIMNHDLINFIGFTIGIFHLLNAIVYVTEVVS